MVVHPILAPGIIFVVAPNETVNQIFFQLDIPRCFAYIDANVNIVEHVSVLSVLDYNLSAEQIARTF